MNATLPTIRYRVENIPAELKALDRWTVFQIIRDPGGKTRKLPRIPGKAGKHSAKADDPKTWRSFAEALQDAEVRGFHLAFVFGLDVPFFFIDGDDVLTADGEIRPDVAVVVDTLDTYTEWSQSGKGLHIIGRGAFPPNPARRAVPEGMKALELYPRRGGRFCVFTGNVLTGLESIEERSDTLAALFPPRATKTLNGNHETKATGTLTDDELNAIVTWAAEHWSDGRRHHMALYLSGELARQGVSREQAEAIIERCAVNDSDPAAKLSACQDTYDDREAGLSTSGWHGLKDACGLTDDELAPLEELLSGFWRRNQERDEEDDSSKKPEINAGDRNLPRISRKALQALIAANNPPRIFLYGGMVARLEPDERGAPILRQLSEDRARHALARSATYFAIDKKNVRHAALPPTYVVKDILATPELPLPALTRIVEVPTYSADGELNETPGYHTGSQTFYAPAAGFSLPPIPENPTAEDVNDARSLIVDELLGGFPFVGQAEIANAAALFLDPLVRDMIEGPTPLRVIEAPSPGSGKGLMASVLLSPAIGREPSVMSAPRDDDEWRKRIFAALRTSPSAILIDNVTRSLDSGALAGALTGLYIEDRVLGLSEMVRVPIRCAWVVTANNVTMSTEIARRTVRIRLDPKVDRPWQRTGFTYDDLRGWAQENRVQLVWSGLTLVRAWLKAGAPLGTVTLGSYERWSAVLGGILGCVGIDSFLGNLEELYEVTDSEGAMLRDFVAAWAEKFGETEVGAAELFEVAGTVEGFEISGNNERAQRTSFGRRLVRMRDRIIGEYRVINTREVSRAKKWRLGRSQRSDDPMNLYEPSDYPSEESLNFYELLEDEDGQIL